MEGNDLDSVDGVLRGILALLVDEREARTAGDREARKVEVILADAGMSIVAIASVTSKSEDAVRKSVQRARKK